MPVIGNADELIPECAEQDFAVRIIWIEMQCAAAVDILGQLPCRLRYGLLIQKSRP